MGVNPPNSAAVYLVMLDELDHFRVCDQGRLAHHLVLGKKFCACTTVTNQQFPVNEIVTEHFIVGEQPVEAARIRFGPSQETDPDRCINKDTHAPRRLRAVLSRRLDTSRAPGSVPRRARRRSYAAWRISASSPNRTVSVSVAARLTVRASWRSFSSMWSVFFIRMILPYHSIQNNRIVRPRKTLSDGAIITIVRRY